MNRVPLGVVGIGALVVAVLPFVGVTSITFSEVFGPNPDESSVDVFWNMRVPRVLFALLVGGVLSISGAAYQSLFRNVLVCPFSLGVSSAAALGASISIATGIAAAYGGESVLAAIGAVFGTALILVIARLLPREATTSLLLCGVVLGFFFSSLVALVQYVSDYAQLFRLSRWMLGALQVVGYKEVGIVAAIALVGTMLLIRYAEELNILSLGHELAVTRGVSVAYVERVVFLSTSLMVGAVVSLSGVVGFVGIMVPHFVRLMLGVDNRRVLPYSFWLGGILVAVCDAVGRSVIPPYEIPVGVFTALMGGPFFVWLVAREKT